MARKCNKKAIKEKFLELLPQFNGQVQATVRHMRNIGIRTSRQALYEWKGADDEFSCAWDQLVDNAKMEVREGLISSLIRLGLEGNVGAIALYFKIVEGWAEYRQNSVQTLSPQDHQTMLNKLPPAQQLACIQEMITMLQEKQIALLNGSKSERGIDGKE